MIKMSAQRIDSKVAGCVRLAREQFDNIRQDPRNAREYKRVRVEAMGDARLWKALGQHVEE